MIDDSPYLKHLPSVIAASAVCLANHTLGKEPWVSESEINHKMWNDF